MTSRQWYYAQLRWAGMAEGREGLREWREAVYIFLSENYEIAFQHAIELGRHGESIYREGRRNIEIRLAEVVRLDCLGHTQTQFEVTIGSHKAKERLPFEHLFHPEQHMPEPVF